MGDSTSSLLIWILIGVWLIAILCNRPGPNYELEGISVVGDPNCTTNQCSYVKFNKIVLAYSKNSDILNYSIEDLKTPGLKRYGQIKNCIAVDEKDFTCPEISRNGNNISFGDIKIVSSFLFNLFPNDSKFDSREISFFIDGLSLKGLAHSN